MFILFGWGHTKNENFGKVLPRKCGNCKNEEYWSLFKISRWFTLFFIPVFPYQTKRFTICPVCQCGTEVNDNQFESYKTIAGINAAYQNQTISQEERDQRLAAVFTELEKNENTEGEFSGQSRV